MKMHIINTNMYRFIVDLFVYLPLEYEDIRVQSELDDSDLFASFFAVGVVEVDPREYVAAHLMLEHNLVLQQGFRHLVAVGGVDSMDLVATMDFDGEVVCYGGSHGILKGAEQRGRR